MTDTGKDAPRTQRGTVSLRVRAEVVDTISGAEPRRNVLDGIVALLTVRRHLPDL